MENNELYHHGIKGMKWGVRRYRNKDGTLTPAGRKRYSDGELSADQKERAARKADVKNRRTLSTSDIQKKIDRLKMEKQLKDLTAEDLSPGRKLASDILKSAGTKVLSAAAAGAAAYAVKVAMTKSFDVKEAANYIASNPNKKK